MLIPPSKAIAAANLAGYRPPVRSERPSPTDFGGTDADIDVIVAHMWRITLNNINEPTVQAIAGHCRRATAEATARACFDFVINHMTYAPDQGGEVLKAPRLTLSAIDPTGDCDDMSMALAALLIANNIPCRFKTIAWRRHEFTHVYVLAQIDGLHPTRPWIPLDPVMHADGFGAERPQVIRTKHYAPPQGNPMGARPLGAGPARLAAPAYRRVS